MAVGSVRARARALLVDVTPLRTSPDFRRLWIGLSLSAIGDRITTIAMPFEVYHLTHSTLLVGLLGFTQLGPRLGLSLLGGAYADSHDRRRIVLGTQAGGALTAVGLTVNAALAHPSVAAIFVLSVVASACFALQSPAERSAIPRLVEPEQLTAAMAIKSGSYSIAWLAGPTVGAFVLSAGGAAWAYGADLVSFAVALPALLRVGLLPPEPHMEGVHPVRSAIDGLRRLRGRHALLGSFAADLDAMVFGMPIALFPALVDHRFHGRTWVYGFLVAAPFAGSLIASALSGWTGRVHRQGVAVTAFVIVWGLAIAAFGLVNGVVASLALLVVAGAADMISGIFRQAMLQRATPPDMLGRMEGVGMAVWTSGPALGDLEAGAVASAFGLTASIVSGGVLCAIGAVALAGALPGFRRYDDRDPQAGDGELGVAPPTPQPEDAGRSVTPFAPVGASGEGTA